MTHRFDIVMPFYGDVDLMREAVRSVLAQDSDTWHLTVIDDHVPEDVPADEARDWFRSLDHEAVTYVRNESNLGLNANFRKALETARAEFVVVMGCDDLMLPHYVSTMEKNLALHPDATVLHPGVVVVDGDGAAVRPLVDRVKSRLRPRSTSPTLLQGESLAASLLRGNWTYFPSLCWRREAMQRPGFRAGLDVVLDLALLLDLAREGGTLLVSPEVTFAYRRHANSLSSTSARTGDRFEEEARYFREIARTCTDDGWPRAARAARVHATSRLHALALAPRTLRGGDLSTSGRLLRHALAPAG
jgi:glycosyltransferase involved in cell wall biosynthesis